MKRARDEKDDDNTSSSSSSLFSVARRITPPTNRFLSSFEKIRLLDQAVALGIILHDPNRRSVDDAFNSLLVTDPRGGDFLESCTIERIRSSDNTTREAYLINSDGFIVKK